MYTLSVFLEVGLSDEYAAIINKHFHSIFSTMMTLIGFMTLDSAIAIYFPLILERPELAVVTEAGRPWSARREGLGEEFWGYKRLRQP